MVDSSPLQQSPTQEKPMLIGFMIDVSLSMIVKNLRHSSAISQKRLDGFREAFDDFVHKGKALCSNKSNQRIIPLFKVFAYGFGFGNVLSWLVGNKSPQVRDLLGEVEGQCSAITIDQLFDHWDIYQSHVKGLLSQTLGTTPMLEAFKLIQRRFLEEREKVSYTDPPILFVLSDGEPTDGTSEEVLRVAQSLQESGVFIVSCYVTDQDIVDAKKLYGSSQVDWPEAAKLAYAYASVLPEGSAFDMYFRELGWKIERSARMFAQVNQTELMREFLEVVLSPLQQWYRSPQLQSAKEKVGQVPESSKRTIRVFISYSHQDRKYLASDSLLGYLKGLEREGFEFWHDQHILAGETWNEEIRKQIASADIALVLVSQAFLNSQYCQESEIASFIMERKKRGLIIVPIILSACYWEEHKWLWSTQTLPRDGKNVESTFKSKGKRDEFFLEVYKNLQAIGSKLKHL